MWMCRQPSNFIPGDAAEMEGVLRLSEWEEALWRRGRHSKIRNNSCTQRGVCVCLCVCGPSGMMRTLLR